MGSDTVIRRLAPSEVGEFAATTAVTLVPFCAHPDRTDVVALARDIGDRLTVGMTDGGIQRRALGTTGPPENHRTVPVVNSSNWGKIPDFTAPRGITVEDFRRAGFSLAISTALEPFYIITSFAGRLGIHIGASTVADIASAQRRAAAVVDELNGIVAAASS
ncbi:phthiocerol/phthiodiolone dimycocerosyl transferase family protein [Nocardia terpenica]|uniref:Phthiocerol/phthiodiolone dimycocerosyl transferase C-terminal domain-containing protein n=1 Tax=Nocardia terpenica TaxID=455432 RepID=A0A164NUG8_9NOCA|nr:hypothetical protein [Nocardia terpenica]KZM74740.1 hypothetical protein AWN90_22065 [Nocardia terpenica]NQE93641.1 hypothetical protein [Nocardia terpenica]